MVYIQIINNERNAPMTTLSDLNALRIDLGMTPLKSWKESKAKLQSKVNELQARYDELLASAPEAPVAKPTPKAKTPAKPAPKSTAKHSPESVAQFYEANGINPKVARAKMRAAGHSAPYTLDQVKAVYKK